MSSWTVHCPENLTSADAVEGAAVVRDGFSWVAFLVPALWLLWHRLWLGLLGFVLLTAALSWGGAAIGLRTLPAMAIALLVSLYIGLEGGALRRAKLERRGYAVVGVVGASSRDEAERRAIALLLEGAPRSRTETRVATNAPAPPAPHPGRTDVLGSFPEPGGL